MNKDNLFNLPSIDIPELCDFGGTLEELKDKVSLLIKAHGGGSILFLDAGHNNISATVITEEEVNKHILKEATNKPLKKKEKMTDSITPENLNEHEELAKIRASIAAIHCRLTHGPKVTDSTVFSIVSECEHAIPELAKLNPANIKSRNNQ